MRRTRARLAIVAVLAAVAAAPPVPAGAQAPIRYRCRRPATGSPATSFRWYVCWPDSTTAVLSVTTPDTHATITHLRTGERVRVEGVDARGRTGQRSVASLPWTPSGPTAVPAPQAPMLRPNAPNPFNPRTTIRYELPVPARVRLRVLALDGTVVARLADGERPAGAHEAVWDGRDDAGRPVASGTYVCRLEAGDTIRALRMSLIR